MADDGSAKKALEGRHLIPVKEEKPRIMLLNGEFVEKQDNRHTKDKK